MGFDRLLGPEGHMGGAPLVLVLVGLAFPILLLVSALVFDVVFATWLAYDWWRRVHPHALSRVLPHV